MHRDVGAAVGQRVLQLLHEQALAARLVQALVEQLVAARGHGQQAHGKPRMQGLQAQLDVLRLPEGEPAAARGDDDGVTFQRSLPLPGATGGG